MILLSPRSTLFPYTTLFRSRAWTDRPTTARTARASLFGRETSSSPRSPTSSRWRRSWAISSVWRVGRSEEHTSELQSHSDLVCRLLLEKKKNKKVDGDK